MLATALFLLLSGAQSAACDTGSASAEQVRSVAEGIIAADNARDIERVLSYYAADAVLMPPNEPAVTGREAIRPRYESLFKGFVPAIEGHPEQLCVQDAFAFVRGTNGGRLMGRDGGPDRILNDAYLMLLQRSASGDWHISHLMWHPAGPR